MTFQVWKMKFSNSMTLQVFHDQYKPCYILSKFTLLNADTPLVWTLYMAPLVSVLMGLAVLAIWPGGEGGTWVFFGWVCTTRDSKLAPRSRKNFP